MDSCVFTVMFWKQRIYSIYSFNRCDNRFNRFNRFNCIIMRSITSLSISYMASSHGIQLFSWIWFLYNSTYHCYYVNGLTHFNCHSHSSTSILSLINKKSHARKQKLFHSDKQILSIPWFKIAYFCYIVCSTIWWNDRMCQPYYLFSNFQSSGLPPRWLMKYMHFDKFFMNI